MKKGFLFCASLLLISGIASAQHNNVNAEKVTVKDSIWLNGNWIAKLNKDTTLTGAKDNEVPSAKAVKIYIDNKVSSATTATITTNDSTPTTIATIHTATNQLARYELVVLAKDSATGLVAQWRVVYLIDNSGGTVTIKTEDIADYWSEGSIVVFDPTATVSGTSVLIKVTGGLGVTLRWSATIKSPQTL